MVRRMTPAQYQSFLRQEQAKQKRAIDQYNRQVKQHNDKVVRDINNYNRAVDVENRRRANNLNKAVNQYNQAVNNHNNQVRLNRQKMIQEINYLKSRAVSTQYVVVKNSTSKLYDSLDGFEKNAKQEFLAQLAARESQNSIDVFNTLTDQENTTIHTVKVDMEEQAVSQILENVSEDLHNRWKGAIFALKPENPDAARHFCASIREVFTEILENFAPDNDVKNMEDCHFTLEGKPTRKSKLIYLLSKNGAVDTGGIENFVDNDIKNITDLFGVFNQATHGAAGRHNMNTLLAIKNRVMAGIIFLSTVLVHTAEATS
jgi:hypothetical protein